MKKNNMDIVHKNSESKNRDAKQNEVSALYEILEKLPKPEVTMRLSASQKKWWYWFGLEFVKTNQFTKVDLMHLHDAAIYMDIKCLALKEANSKIENIFEKYSKEYTDLADESEELYDRNFELEKKYKLLNDKTGLNELFEKVEKYYSKNEK